MIQFETTTNYSLLNKLVRESPVYKYGTDDFSPPQAEAKVIETPYIQYILVYDNTKLVGFISLLHMSIVKAEFHPLILLNAQSIDIMTYFFKWVWKNTSYHRLSTFIPEDNKIAARMAERYGLIKFGFEPDAMQRNQKLIGIYLFGISRPKET